MRHTLDSFSQITDPIKVRGLWFMPDVGLSLVDSSPQLFETESAWGRQLRTHQSIPAELRDYAGSSDFAFFKLLESVTAEDWQAHQLWINQLPIPVRQKLRYNWLWTEADHTLDFWQNIRPIPLTGVSFAVDHNSPLTFLFDHLPLARLAHVSQLGTLHNVRILADGTIIPMTEPDYRHNRLSHSVGVCALSGWIGQNLGLPEHEMIHLFVAALTHDIRTPCLSDSFKQIDPVRFDEDRTFHIFQASQGWETVRNRFDLDDQLIYRIIQNQGLLGQILDVADKLVYLGDDFEQYLPPILRVPDGQFSPSIGVIQQLVTDNPYPGAVWQDLILDNGQLVFTHHLRLFTWLKLRVLMFRNVYFFPEARFLEMTIVRLALEELLKQDFHAEDALVIDDFQRRELLFNLLGTRLNNTLDCPFGEAGVLRFKTEADLWQGVVDVTEAGHYPLAVENLAKRIKTGTHFLVATPTGRAMFRDAYPELDHALRQLAEPETPHILYLLKEVVPGFKPIFYELITNQRTKLACQAKAHLTMSQP